MPSYIMILNYTIFFSLNQVSLTALDTFFSGDPITGSASFFRVFFCDQPELAP